MSSVVRYPWSSEWLVVGHKAVAYKRVDLGSDTEAVHGAYKRVENFSVQFHPARRDPLFRPWVEEYVPEKELCEADA
jgi:hypothetical protein